MLHGYPVAAGAIFGLLAIRLWHYKKAPRLTAWLFGLAAGLLTIGVTVWLDALAGLTATGTGLTVLIAVILIGGVSWYFEGIRKHKHHRVWTPVLGIVFGSAIPLAIALFPRMLHKATRVGPGTSSALSQAVSQVHSGGAATALAPGDRLDVLGVGLAALAVLVFLAIRHERKGGGKSGGGKPAIESSSGGGGRRGGRRALTSGRR
jgi:hypothetical protein